MGWTNRGHQLKSFQKTNSLSTFYFALLPSFSYFFHPSKLDSMFHPHADWTQHESHFFPRRQVRYKYGAYWPKKEEKRKKKIKCMRVVVIGDLVKSVVHLLVKEWEAHVLDRTKWKCYVEIDKTGLCEYKCKTMHMGNSICV